MARRVASKPVDKSQASAYAETGRVFLESAKALALVADAAAPYGNAIGLLAIHATISYSDALSIAFGGRKSTGAHTEALNLLRDVLENELPAEMARKFERIVAKKDAISYRGLLFPLADGRKLLASAEAFCVWARDYLQRSS